MLINKEYLYTLKQNGFVSFPLLKESDINELKKLYQKFETEHLVHEEGFKKTSSFADKNQVLEINKRVSEIIAPILPEHFKAYQMLGCNYLIKSSNSDQTKVPLHQDWTYVDETKFYSMNVWIALEDIDERNGCLFFIPGSHRIGNFLRSAPSYPVPFSQHIDFLEKFKVPVPVKAGTCICFNNKTIHGSFANMGNTNRLVVVTTLFPENAKLLHHYIHDLKKPEIVTEYHISKDTFLTLETGKHPASFFEKRIVKTHYPGFSPFYFFYKKLFMLTEDFFK